MSVICSSLGGGWNIDLVSHLFGAALAERLLSIVVLVYAGLDVRVWGSVCISRVMIKDLYEVYKGDPIRRLDGANLGFLRGSSKEHGVQFI